MKGLALNENNDIIVNQTSVSRNDAGAYVAQKLKSRLQTIQGENEDYPDEGIPYFTDIFVKPVNLRIVGSLFKTVILGTEGVNELLSFTPDYDPDTRNFTLSFSVNTDYGEIDINSFTVGPVGG